MYDPAWARDWDAVGLVCGDPSAPVRRVLLAVDPVEAVVDEAVAWHADLLLTHHPLLLRAVHGVPATSFKGRSIHRLVRAGCGLYTAHTNADVAAPGVSDALARVLGLTDLEPLAADPRRPDRQDRDLRPRGGRRQGRRRADRGAGGGDRRVLPLRLHLAGDRHVHAGSGARPTIGEIGRRTESPSTGWRWSCRGSAGRRGRGAAHRAPLRGAGVRRLRAGRLVGPAGHRPGGRLAAPTTLREFAMLVAEALPGSAQGVRIAGDPMGEVSRVAVCGGAGDGLLDAVRASGADVFVTADLRHHVASEAREAAGEGRPTWSTSRTGRASGRGWPGSPTAWRVPSRRPGRPSRCTCP